MIYCHGADLEYAALHELAFQGPRAPPATAYASSMTEAPVDADTKIEAINHVGDTTMTGCCSSATAVYARRRHQRVPSEWRLRLPTTSAGRYYVLKF